VRRTGVLKVNKKIISSAVALSVVLGTFTAGGSISSAQENEAQGPKIQFNEEYQTPSYIVENWAPKSKKGLSKRDIAFAYLGENSQKFKLKGDMKKHFKVTEEQADKKTGTHHFRLIEQYNGIPIFGSDSTVALDKNDNVTSFFGEVVPNLDDKGIKTETAISDKEAINKAKEAIEKKIGKVDQYDGEVTAEQFIYEFEGKFYNTYLVKASTVEPQVGYWHYFIDAANGNIVDHYNAAQEVTTFGYGVFNNKQMFEAQLIDGVYGLNDTTRGLGIVTNDAKNGNKMVTSPSKMFNQDGAAVDAHANAQKVYDYFLKTFDRNSVDNKGQKLISAVHVNTNWNNASWNGRQMSYGDGDGAAYHNFAAGLDVAAHEMAHGVTQNTANLVYRNESGALNESMSDIFAAMVDRDDHEWLIGEKIIKDGRKALRSMSNPAEIVDTRTESGFSPDHWSKRYTGTLDSGGVHINSSINNKAAYLISEGGKHYGVTVKGVGRDATEQIYYRALSKYLTSSSNFTMMRQAAIQASTDLYGSNSAHVKGVTDAYNAVGVFDPGLASFPDPIDSQSWTLPRDMTWADYKPVPGIDWNTSTIKPERVLRGALIIVDFKDRDFILSQSKGSEIAGNPVGAGNIPRDQIGKFWEDFLNKPQPLNNYRTINEYWRENSYGKWKIEVKSFGTYRMEGNEFEYGLNEFGQTVNMPAGYKGRNLRTEAVNASKADIAASGEKYDFNFVIHAGYDESGIWQEFGEMMFTNPESVTNPFGPNFPGMPNWAVTRYVPWTSWYAAKAIWSSASGGTSVQGENSGMATFAHEFGHIMNLGDNYNNPYGNPVSRTYTGPWEVMSRGSFNGPGGPHSRWMIPANQGESAPSHHMLRNKIKQGFLSTDQYLSLESDKLAETGPVFSDILAREVPSGNEFGRSGLLGININMVDLTPRNYLKDDWRADMQNGEKWYNNYTLEVVDRVGFDSFVPDSGVLLAKTKNSESAPNIWVVDSHKEDINLVDFKRPDGSTAMLSKGDYQQLADATFKAGTGKDVVSEYEDVYNRLHFYILDKKYDDKGALSYRVAVRHMDGAGSFVRGVTVSNGSANEAVPGRVATYNFTVKNTGAATDLFRINVKTDGNWETQIQNNVIEVGAGQSVTVPVYVKIPNGKPSPTNLTFTSTSETDKGKSSTVTRSVVPFILK